MKVGILGSGPVGQRLGDAFVSTGHTVMIGTRNPVKVHPWVSKHARGKASSGSFADAAAFAEIGVLATLWEGTEAALKSAGPKNLAGKIVIMRARKPRCFSSGMSASGTYFRCYWSGCMLEQGMKTLIANCNMRRVGRSTELNLYHMLRKADNGLGSDTVPRQLRECTPVEIECSVVEAGSGDEWQHSSPCPVNHVTVERNASPMASALGS